LCRFSDAGNVDLTTRSGGRHPKTAKARNRGKYARWTGPLAQLWGFERRACRVHAGLKRLGGAEACRRGCADRFESRKARIERQIVGGGLPPSVRLLRYCGSVGVVPDRRP